MKREAFLKICTTNLQSNNQSGFRPGHSITFQLIDISSTERKKSVTPIKIYKELLTFCAEVTIFHHICQSFDKKQYSCMIFCDIPKAFDKVWHEGLLFKLRQNGIKSKLLAWMRTLKHSFSRQALNQMYVSYVRPLLEYSSIVWDGCTQQDKNALDRLQNEAARIVTGLTLPTSIVNHIKNVVGTRDSLAKKNNILENVVHV